MGNTVAVAREYMGFAPEDPPEYRPTVYRPPVYRQTEYHPTEYHPTETHHNTPQVTTRQCHHFARGTCSWGAECRFSHGDANNNPFAFGQRQAQSNVPPQRPCRFYAKGHCRNGTYCSFLHKIDTGEKEKQSKQTDDTTDRVWQSSCSSV